MNMYCKTSGHNEPLDPSYHFKPTKNSLGSKWRSSAADGTTDTKKQSEGLTQTKYAYFCGQLLKKTLAMSEADDYQVSGTMFYLIGEDRTDSTEMAPDGRTWLLKREMACTRY